MNEDRRAAAAWSRLAEPGDVVAGAVVEALGPAEALDWVRAAAAGDELVMADTSRARLRAAVARWSPRLDGLDVDRDLRLLDRLGGEFLTPGDPGWPERLRDLGRSAPHALWCLGDPAVLGRRGVAVIGARACTAYGEHVAAEMAAGLAGADRVVVSGGAYGIDAVAHRAAMTTSAATVAVLAGGVDRPYPAGNVRLLAGIRESGGAVVAEVPPGAAPSRSRFLQRNRLIAALSDATVVVEAAWRSGTLSTAGHAADLLRPVGAVPGPVTSAASSGCHRLLREGIATCVTDHLEVLELVEPVGAGTAGGGTPPPGGPEPPGPAGDGSGATTPQERAVLEAMPLRGSTTVDRVARAAGCGVHETAAALGMLELAGLVTRSAKGWVRSRGTNRT